MLTSDQIDALRDRANELTAEMEEILLKSIARRIRKAGQFTSTAAYEIWRAQQLGLARREIQQAVQKQLKMSSEEIESMFKQSAEVGYSFDLNNHKAGIPFERNGSLQQLVRAAVKQAEKDFTNLTKTAGMVVNGKPLLLRQAYRAAMDKAFKQVFTGTKDYESSIREACRELADHGLISIDYDSGRTTTLEAAVRRNIMGGLGLMQEEIGQKNHETIGANGWEISAHANSAPDHEDIQGKQYTDAEFQKLNKSLARPIGTLNCGHVAFPIILGISKPQYTPAQLREMKEANARGITYQGRHYSKYQATQMQRKLERAMRREKRRIIVSDGIEKQTCQIKLRRLREEYNRFSKAAGLRTQPERAWVAGFGGKKE